METNEEKCARQAEAFWARVRKTKKCWIWTGGKNKKGYGAATYGGKTWRVHRLAWLLSKGAIPDGLFVCHRCDVRVCCNPDHLFLGTNQDNMADMRAKGRDRGGLQAMHNLLQQRKNLVDELARVDVRIIGQVERITKIARDLKRQSPEARALLNGILSQDIAAEDAQQDATA